MIQKILEILHECCVDVYSICETGRETAELFFIKKNLDMRRKTKTDDIVVTVYRDFVINGENYRGNASFNVSPSTSDKELKAKCKKAYMAAKFVPNKFYDLAPAKKAECFEVESGLNGIGIEQAASKFVNAVYKEDTDENAFINSAEFFAVRDKVRIVNSNGVDVSYIKNNVNGEFVVQCKNPQDVETHQSFSYDDLNTKEISELVRNTLKLTKDRAKAVEAPKAGKYDIVLSGKYVDTVLGYYKDRANGAYVYQQYSDYETGKEIGADINVENVPTVPYSSEGVEMKNLVCIEDGKLKNMHANCRYAYYLGMKPTGVYSKISVQPGDMSFDDMKAHKGLYVVNFSDFQMDSLSGFFGGEIRLAYYNDGEKIVPVTGGSVNGTIIDAQKDFEFSKETQETSTFAGPKAILLKDISVAGK